MFDFSRRQFISHASALLTFAAMHPWRTAAQNLPATKTRLILLGTGGGPRPRKSSFASSQVIIVNNVAYVVDCATASPFSSPAPGYRCPHFAKFSLPTSIRTIPLIMATCSSWRGRAG